jgi:hypothetical protein
MTLAALDNTKDYAGDDVTVAFPIPFPFLSNTHIKVYIVVDATGVETLVSTYSLSGAGGLTGTCTMDVAPATGETLYIRRVLPLTQETDYQDNDAFGAATSEASLDRLMMVLQQLRTDLDRALRQEGQIGDSFDAGGAKIINLDDGVAVTDAMTVGQASALVNAAVALVQSFPALSVVTAFALTLLDDANAAAMRTTLGLGPLATSAAAGTTGEVIRGDGTASSTLTDDFTFTKAASSAGTVVESLYIESNNSGFGEARSRIALLENNTNKKIEIFADSLLGLNIVGSESIRMSFDNGITQHALLYIGGLQANALELGYREIGWTTHNADFTLDLATDLTAIPNNGIRKTNNTAYNYTIPLDATDNFPDGYVLPIANMGSAGAISVIPTVGVTLRLAGSTSASATRTFAAGAFGGICKMGTDDWMAYGSGVS